MGSLPYPEAMGHLLGPAEPLYDKETGRAQQDIQYQLRVLHLVVTIRFWIDVGVILVVDRDTH